MAGDTLASFLHGRTRVATKYDWLLLFGREPVVPPKLAERLKRMFDGFACMKSGDRLRFIEGPFRGLIGKIVEAATDDQNFLVEFYTGRRFPMTRAEFNEWKGAVVEG